MKSGAPKMLTKSEIFVVILIVIALILIVFEIGQGRNWAL
jgi:hypothetical protein